MPPPPSTAPRADRFRAGAIAGATAILAALVYLPALGNEFVNWDDPTYVAGNDRLGLPFLPFVKWAISTLHFFNWHPLTWLSFKIDHSIWGLQPHGYHLTNLLLHALNSLLVVLLTRALFLRAWTAPDPRPLVGGAIAGVLFALHPLHVESVAWVSERKDLLYACFWLLSLLAYLSYVSYAGPPRAAARTRAYYLCLGLFALSLMSKPMAVSLPLVLLILDAYPLGRLDGSRPAVRSVLVEKIPFVALSLFSSVVTIVAQRGALNTLEELSLGGRLCVAAQALVFYVGKTLAPVSLVPIYPIDSSLTPLRWDCIASFAAVVGVAVLCAVYRRKRPVFFAAASCFFVTLLPVLGLVQVGAQAAADRYMYLPILGPVTILAAGGAWLWMRPPPARLLLVGIVCVVAGALGLSTLRQIAVWKDSVSLWRYVAEKEPDEPVSYFNLGNFYRSQGDLESAERSWERAVQLVPPHSQSLNQLGNLAYLRKAFPVAARYYRRAVESDPGNSEAQLNLARTLDALGEREAAAEHYRLFLREAPAEYRYLFGDVRRRLGLPTPPP
jgi:hypothetical protein